MTRTDQRGGGGEQMTGHPRPRRGTWPRSTRPATALLVLACAGFLTACGGGGNSGQTLPTMHTCPDGTMIPTGETCPPPETLEETDAPAPGAESDTETITPAGGGGPSPRPSPGAPTPTTTTPTSPPAMPVRGTYATLRDRILAATDPAALVETLDPATLTANQYDSLFELALIRAPDGSSPADQATARQIVVITDWPTLDKALADRTINLADNPALIRLHAAHRAELVTREATQSAFLAPNLRADVPGTRVPVPGALGSGLPPNADDLDYAVWMDPGGTIHRWSNRQADVIYTRAEIQAIAPENRIGADGATASFAGTATGFAAHTDGTAGAMTADVALTLAFGIDSTDDDRFDVAPSLTGTIDNFRLVGQTGDLGWTAMIDGTVAPGDLNTGKPPYLVRNTNALDVAFSTDRVTGGMGSTMPAKTHPPTHAAGAFDLTFTDGRAVGAFNALSRETPAP